MRAARRADTLLASPLKCAIPKLLKNTTRRAVFVFQGPKGVGVLQQTTAKPAGPPLFEGLMNLSYKYRLYPNCEQRETLDRILWIHRGLYNDALTERRLAWEKNRKSINYTTQASQLKAIREFDEDAAWLNYSSIQQTLRRLDKAFQAFFRRVKAGETPGYPRYKGRHRFNSVRYVYGDGLRLCDGRLYVQRVGDVRLFQHRPLPDDSEIKSAIIKRDGLGNWYVILQIEMPDPEPLPDPLEAVGVDMGLLSFVALSTGEEVDNPRWFRAGEERLAVLQQRRARCKQGSRQCRELSRLIRRHHEHIKNKRLDFQHKLSRVLVDRCPILCTEDPNIAGLARSHVAKSMGDAGWAQFLAFLTYKAAKAGGERIAVDARNTSKVCPACGCMVEKSLSVRVHDCPHCGFVVSRDVASAQVILIRGMARMEPGRKVFPASGRVAGSSPL